jgi:hypothetical protein
VASRKSLCPDCLLPPSECLGHDDEPDEPGPGECDAAEFGAAATFLPGGTCRCIVCPRCGHHTGNAHQGHYWALCKVLLGRARESLPPGETLSLDELHKRALREFHFCCPGNCELEAEEAHVG